MDSDALPELVRAYVARNAAAGATPGTVVRVTQRGEMRRSPTEDWSPFTAREDLWTGECAFDWRAVWRLNPSMRVRVHDGLHGGAGRMRGRLWGVVPVLSAKGPGIDRGSLMRYLAELPWAPAALTANPELRFRELGPSTVEVSAELRGAPVAVRLEFDHDGDIASAWTPARPRDTPDGVVDTPWGGTHERYERLGDWRIPTRCEVWWDLPDGRFTWFRAEVTDVHARRP
jgi:hypothetical protein